MIIMVLVHLFTKKHMKIHIYNNKKEVHTYPIVLEEFLKVVHEGKVFSVILQGNTMSSLIIIINKFYKIRI